MEGLVDREVARDRLIDKTLTLSEEEKQAALRVYIRHLGINSERELSRWMESEFLEKDQLH